MTGGGVTMDIRREYSAEVSENGILFWRDFGECGSIDAPEILQAGSTERYETHLGSVVALGSVWFRWWLK